MTKNVETEGISAIVVVLCRSWIYLFLESPFLESFKNALIVQVFRAGKNLPQTGGWETLAYIIPQQWKETLAKMSGLTDATAHHIHYVQSITNQSINESIHSCVRTSWLLPLSFNFI
jgi:hypothetical protein